MRHYYSVIPYLFKYLKWDVPKFEAIPFPSNLALWVPPLVLYKGSAPRLPGRALLGTSTSAERRAFPGARYSVELSHSSEVAHISRHVIKLSQKKKWLDKPKQKTCLDR